MSDHYMRKTLNGLVPTDGSRLPTVKVGEIVKVKISRPRNRKHQAKYWALINTIFDNQSLFATPEHLHQWVKRKTGFAQEITVRGEPTTVYDSTSFESMDQTAFEQYYQRVLDLICEQILPGLGESEVRAEIESMVA
jgi:hypothetical protein